MSITKRIIAILLAAMMLFQCAPMPTVHAEGGVTVRSNVLQGQEYFKVTFQNGGAAVAEQYVVSGSTLVLPEDPTMQGHRFVGWFADGQQVTAETAVTSDMVVTAVFQAIACYTFTVQYVGADGSPVMEPAQFSYTVEDELPVNGDGIKYVNFQVPAEVHVNDVALFPSVPSVTFLLTGATTQTVTVTYAKTDVTYSVEHYGMTPVRAADGSVSFSREKAQLINTQSNLNGVAGSYVVPQAMQLEHYIFDSADEIKLSPDSASNIGKAYYRPAQYTLTFDAQGGSYVEPSYAYYGESFTLPTAAPTREGYTFGGWYLDAACTQPAASMTVSGNATVYAKWTPGQVNYTVVYMKQAYNANNELYYQYYTSKTATGTVGQMTNVTVNRSDIPSRYEVGEVKNVVVEPDGSSVVIVNLDLIVYTLKFNCGQNGTINGRQEYTITARLGQNIAALWPTADMIQTSNRDPFYGWKHPNFVSIYATRRFEVTDDMLPQDGSTSVTYTARYRSGTEIIVLYCLQDPNNPTQYPESNEYSQVLISAGDLSPKSLYGFTLAKKQTLYGQTITFGGKTYTDITVYKFSYNRNQYNIEYFYNSTKLKTDSKVYFGANISSKNWTPTPESVGLPSDYKFAGWYDNAGCLGDPYVFGKMPAGNLALYAKFTPPQRTLTLVDQGEVFKTIAVTLGQKVTELPTPTRPGYEFVGWYSGEVGGNIYDVNMPLTQNVTYYAHWKQVTLSYTVQYQDADGNTLAAERVVANANFVIGQQVTEQAITIAGYRPVALEASLTLSADLDENVIIFVYQKNADTAYTIRYLEQGTDTSIMEEKVVPVSKESGLVRVTEFAPVDVEFGGKIYYPTTAFQSLMLTVNAEENVITFYYLPYKTAPVVVEFYYYNVSTGEYEIDPNLTRNEQLVVGASVNAGSFAADPTYTKNDVYKLGSVNPANITVTEAMAGITQTMKLYFDLNVIAYQVNYYLYGTTTPVATSTIASAVIGSQVDIDPAVPTGDYAHAVFDSYGAGSNFANGKLTLSMVAAENVVNVYYKLPVTVTANNAEYTYDGTPKTVEKDGSEYTVSGLLATDTLSADVKYQDGTILMDSATNVGTYPAVVSVETQQLPGYYTVATVNGTLTINKIASTIVVTANSANKIYDGTRLADNGFTYTGVLAEGDRVVAAVVGSQTNVGNSANRVDDVKIMRGNVDVTANYTIGASVNGTLTVTPKAVTITGESKTVTYNGATQTITGTTAAGLVEGHDYTVTYAASGMTVGTYDGAFEDDLIILDTEGNNVTGNYAPAYVPGELTIVAYAEPIVVTAASDTKVYDGTALKAGYTAKGTLMAGDELVVELKGSQTDVGTSVNEIVDVKVMHGELDVTENYANIQTANGELIVTPRPVIILSGSDQKEFDRLPLTCDLIWIGADGFVGEQGVIIEMTGSQINVGSSENTFTYTAKENTNLNNYKIDVYYGKLVVTGEPIIPEKTTPEVTGNYVVGDAIPFTITVENVTDETMTDVIVIDETAVLLPGEGYVLSEDGMIATIPALAPNQIVTILAEHVVTEEDVIEGAVENVATVIWQDKVYHPSAETDQIEDLDTSMEVVKTSNVALNKKVHKGDTITYTITVTNTGNVTYHNILVDDQLEGVVIQEGEGYIVMSANTASIPALAPGETVTITATYRVTSADVAAGQVWNHVVAAGDPIPDPDVPDVPQIPEGEDTVVNLIKQTTVMQVGDCFE